MTANAVEWGGIRDITPHWRQQPLVWRDCIRVGLFASKHDDRLPRNFRAKVASCDVDDLGIGFVWRSHTNPVGYLVAWHAGEKGTLLRKSPRALPCPGLLFVREKDLEVCQLVV